MDLNSLFRVLLPTMTHNLTGHLTSTGSPTAAGLDHAQCGDAGSGPGSSSSSHSSSSSATSSGDAHVLEGLLPMLGLRGLAPVYGLLGNWLGIDPGIMLTALGILWAAQKVWQQLYSFAWMVIARYFMSSIHVSSTDDIYMHLMKWLATQPRLTESRSIMAETTNTTAWEDKLDASAVARDSSGKYLNFSNQEARAPPRFVPAMGGHSFWWQGQYFKLFRKQESVFDEGGGWGSTFREKEDLVISCFWGSPEPIKRLLQHAKDQYYSNHHARTLVKRPYPVSTRRYSRYNLWQVVANRPVRDMRTVVLDKRQKLRILADMNEYLHPWTPRWYANRGIPLRRGYLFHGPPGTGKTSLSFALAGVFGLDIHVISLLEPSLTEEDLSTLLGSLPRRCIVLLEDIDTAGLRRTGDDAKDKKAEEKTKKDDAKKDGKTGDDSTTTATTDAATTTTATTTPENPNNWKLSDLAKALKESSSSEDKKEGISLSGLLNAIDGVASHEGRVLIMTTNAPESLDEALIRPGRVDLQVAFSNATVKQAEELFVRMYESDEKVEALHNKSSFSGAQQQQQKQKLEKSVVINGGAKEKKQVAIIPSGGAGSGIIINGSAGTPTKTKKKKKEKGGHRLVNGLATPTTSGKESSDEDADEDVASKTGGNDVIKRNEEERPSVEAIDDANHKENNDKDEADEEDSNEDSDSDSDDDDDDDDDDEEEEEAGDLSHLSPEDQDARLTTLSKEFAAKIPAGRFSPAEIQGFLLKRKKHPLRAVAEADEWVAALLRQKESHSKVLDVQ